MDYFNRAVVMWCVDYTAEGLLPRVVEFRVGRMALRLSAQLMVEDILMAIMGWVRRAYLRWGVYMGLYKADVLIDGKDPVRVGFSLGIIT